MLHIAYFQSLAFAAAVFCQVQKSSFHVVAFSRNPSFTESSRLAFVAAPGTHTTSSKTIFDRTHRHTGSITPPFRISPIDAVSGEDTGGGVSLSPILSNHGDDGRDLGLSVARHLDAEWMDQEVHDKIGDAVTDLYTEARCNGVGDVMGVMIFVSEGLEKRWKEFDKDAFVNCWDVGNYISDYLVQKVSDEACACSSTISPSVPRDAL